MHDIVLRGYECILTYFCNEQSTDKLVRYLSSKWRGTEVAITALTRNQMVRVTWHVGSNPTLSAQKVATPVLVEDLLFQHTQRHTQKLRLAVYSWKIVLRYATSLYQ